MENIDYENCMKHKDYPVQVITIVTVIITIMVIGPVITRLTIKLVMMTVLVIGSDYNDYSIFDDKAGCIACTVD